MAIFVGRENVLALTIKPGMCVFLCLDKNEISIAFLLEALPCASNDKLYDKNSNILIDMVFVMNSLSGLLLV